MLKIGEKAPDFELPSGDGKIFSLKDFAGKKLVLYFYPKDNTTGCTKEACLFESKLPTIKKKGAVVVGVSADRVISHKKFAEKYKLHFSLLSDEKKDIIKAYDVWQEKSMYGKKYFGVERTTVIIDAKGVVRHIFRKVIVDGHVEEVLAAL